MRYGLVGAVNAGVYLGVYAALVVVDVPYLLASVLAFPVSVIAGYWLHEHWTFARGTPSWRGLVAFGATQVVALVLATALLAVLVEGLGADAIVGRVIVTPLAPLFTYVVSRAWIFSAQPEPGPAAGPATRPADD